MDNLWQDLRYGFRMLVKSPGFTAVAVITLALGIGANTAIFTLINAVFLNPLPVQEASRLVNVHTTDVKNSQPNFNLLPVSFRNYEDFRDQSDVFAGLAAFGQAPLTLTGEGDPKQFPGMLVTANYFDVLGVKAIRGRTFLPDEDKTPGGNPVAVISHSLWTREFGSDPNIVGKVLTLNSTPFTVIGVAPPNFKGTSLLAAPDLIWIPYTMHGQVLTGLFAQYFIERRALMAQVFGRLKPEVSLERAESVLQTIAARLEKEYPTDNEGRSVRLISTAQAAIGPNAIIGANQRGQFVLAGGLLMTVVGLILLIACVNLANLLLARAATREKEMGIRAALGAARHRLLRQMLTESVLLALAGGAAGLLVAYWGRDLLWSLRPPFLDENAIQLNLDSSVLGFTLGISLLTGILFGLAPAIRASDPDLNETLKVGGRGGTIRWSRSRLRSALVVSEIALALMALIGAGLFIRSMQYAQRLDPGFESDKLLMMAFNPGAQRYDPERTQQFYEQVIERAESVPGVEAATVASNFPVGGGFMRSVFPEGRTQEPGERGILVTTNQVAPGYFDTLRIPLLRGRMFNAFDRENTTPVVVINEVMAKRFWPDQDPLGKRFTFFGDETLREVVGLVRNTVVVQVGEDPQPVVYLPLRQSYSPFATLQVRTTGPPQQVLAMVRQRVQELDRNLAITNVNTIGEVFDQALWAPQIGAGLLGLFGVLALGLAAVGIYGVMAQSVNQRTQEIGIRLALGAQPADILKLVVRQGMALALVGIGTGLLLSLVASRFVSSLLFGISATDPATFLGIPLILSLVALLACLIPARRATRVDPIVALRYE